MAPSPSPGPSPEPMRAPLTSSSSVTSSNGSVTMGPVDAAPAPFEATVEEGHHHFHRELVVAIVLSIAGVTIVLALLYACILWRRSRRAPYFKDTPSSDTTRIALVPILNKFNSFKTSKKGLVAMEYASLEAVMRKFRESNVLGVGSSSVCTRPILMEELSLR